MYGQICTALGKLPAEIDSMEMDDALMLVRYWQKSPPVHIGMRLVLKGLFGMKDAKAEAREQTKQFTPEQEATAMAALKAFAQDFGRLGVH